MRTLRISWQRRLLAFMICMLLSTTMMPYGAFAAGEKEQDPALASEASSVTEETQEAGEAKVEASLGQRSDFADDLAGRGAVAAFVRADVVLDS